MRETISSITVRQGVKTKLEAHRAYLTVVGWADVRENGEAYIGSVRVESVPEKWRGKRVRANLYPSPYYPQIDTVKGCQAANIRAATKTDINGCTFEIVGHLIRKEPGSQRITVEVFPKTRGIPRFRWRFRASSIAIANCNSDWSGIKVRGSVIGVMLFAEKVSPAYAPIAPHWESWRRPRKETRVQAGETERQEAEKNPSASGGEAG